MPLDRVRLLDSIQTGQPRNITVSLLKFSSKWGLWSCPQQPMSVSTGYSGKSFIHALAWWRRLVCVCGTSERMFQTSTSGGRRGCGGSRTNKTPPHPDDTIMCSQTICTCSSFGQHSNTFPYYISCDFLNYLPPLCMVPESPTQVPNLNPELYNWNLTSGQVNMQHHKSITTV